MMAKKEKASFGVLFRSLCWIEAALLLTALLERAI